MGLEENIELEQFKFFLDHILLLFPFEKKYFDKENIKSTFTGHPLLEDCKINSKIDINQITQRKTKRFFQFFQVVDCQKLIF